MTGEASGSATPQDAANNTANVDAGKPNNESAAAPDEGKDNANAAGDKKPGDKPDGITPDVQKYIDSQAAAARRAGEAKGKQAKEDEIEAAKVEAQRVADLEAGKHKELYDNEVTAHTATKTELATAQGDLDKLRAALAGQVPNPLDNYKRIVGDDYDAMLIDAKTLAASFGNNAHRDPNSPPIVPNANDGGKFEQSTTSNDKATMDDVARNRGGYNVL